MVSEEGGMFYRRLGVTRVINAGSWLTVLGGSIMPPAVIKAMEDASRWFVDMNELNAKAGDIIARLTGAEAGLVTSGSAGGMLLQAAATMTGNDPAKAHRLPDTTGMKNEIILHRAHLVNYSTTIAPPGQNRYTSGTSPPPTSGSWRAPSTRTRPRWHMSSAPHRVAPCRYPGWSKWPTTTMSP